jgi:hypothetical protein
MGPLLTTVIALLLFLTAFPAWVAGFFAQRHLERYLFSWRLRLLIWLSLSFASAYIISALYQHGLQVLYQRELTTYVLAAKHYQTDFLNWPWGAIWANTWPVWVRTLFGIPIAALFQELATRGGQTARQLRQNERRRENRAQHLQRRARKRTSRPELLPDEVGGMMVVGIPIDDDTNEEV